MVKDDGSGGRTLGRPIPSNTSGALGTTEHPPAEDCVVADVRVFNLVAHN
jgi:hypothetical protein